MSTPVATKWNAIYRRRSEPDQPVYVLTEFVHLLSELPEKAKALDLACGLSGNCLFMAKKGLQVTAWDISDLAIEQLMHFANKEGVELMAEVRDVESNPPPANTFDVILVSRFLNRELCPYISRSLKPKGWLLYQTFTRAGASASATGPSNPAYLLDENELPALFPDLDIKVYLDECESGEEIDGLTGQVCMVAQRR